jgi:hypothetical protein
LTEIDWLSTVQECLSDVGAGGAMSEAVDKSSIVAEIETLRVEHRELDQRLLELDAQLWLTPEEQVERRNCQKLKLLKKDRIFELSQLIES